MVIELDDASSLLTTFTDILCQVVLVRMSREHIVGSVHRCGQLNAVFATLVGLAKRFEAYLSQLFGDVYGYVAFTNRSDA